MRFLGSGRSGRALWGSVVRGRGGEGGAQLLLCVVSCRGASSLGTVQRACDAVVEGVEWAEGGGELPGTPPPPIQRVAKPFRGGSIRGVRCQGPAVQC